MKKAIIIFVLIAISLFSVAQNKTVPLFNGKDFTNWKMLPGKVPGFEISDGNLVTTQSKGSDIFTEKWFGNYILKFEYLLSKVGNSGVLIRFDPQDPWGTGVEVQLLAPWTPHRDDLHCTGSIYGYVAVDNRPDETTDIWHQMEIECDRNIITISVDNKISTVANIDTVSGMKDKYLQGAIGFQTNHSHEGEYAQFRNISIRDFDNEPEYVTKGFYDENVRWREQAYKAAKSIGAPMIEHLVHMLKEENVMVRTGAKQVLFDIIAKATAPDTPNVEKTEVIKALENSSKQNFSKSVSEYLKWLLTLAKSS